MGQCQLLALRKDLTILPLRGNVNSRLAKLEQGDFDAIILASAGVKRLGLAEHNRTGFALEQMLPAIGQGALGIECRQDDTAMIELLTQLDHAPTRRCIESERALNACLNGNCQTPIAGHAQLQDHTLQLDALVGSPDGHNIIRAQASGDASQPQILGQRVAADLLDQGADRILQACAH